MGWRGFGFVHHSRTVFGRAVPNPNITIRNFSSPYVHEHARGVQRWKRFANRNAQGLARGDGKWPLNDGQVPNVRGVRVHVSRQSCRGESAGVAKWSRERSPTRNPTRYKPIAELIDPRSLMLDFSLYQSGIDFKCPYSNRPLNPLTP
jgi:hypothetical protein